MIVYLLISVVLIIPLWKIFQKAGKNPALSVISLLPLFGFMICLAILAFSNWIVDTKLLEEQ